MNLKSSRTASQQPRAVRLPLQVGLAGLGQTTRYAVLLWLGPLLLLAAAMFAPAFPAVLSLLWILVIGLAGVCAIAFALEAAESAKRDRPSDLELDADGIRIIGLEKHRRTLRWSELDAARCELVSSESRRAVRWLLLSLLTFRKVPAFVAREQVPVFQLRVPLRSGKLITLAEAEGDERASLTALRDSIRSAQASTADEPPRELAPEILLCPSCGAPQVPIDRESTPCPYCGHELTIPRVLREKLHALSTLQKRDTKNAQLIEKLLAQPSAESANRLLWFGRKLLVLIQPAAIIYLGVLLYHQTESAPGSPTISIARITPNDDVVFLYDATVLVLVVVAAFWIVWSALSAYFSNRQALRMLAESFGAVPPAKPGAPFTCRQCGAPLPTTAGAVLVRCVYCSVENVLGVDPRPAAARKQQIGVELDRAISARNHARRRLWLTIPSCLLCAAAIAREAALAWWVPQANPDAETYAYHSHFGVIQNLDGVRRSLVLKDDSSLVHATILPHGSLFWDCGASCSIELGSHRILGDDFGQHSTLVISRGTLSASTAKTTN